MEGIHDESEPVTSLLNIHLDTGRHHQIRVQMAHIGCPLAGDRKYGNGKCTGPLKLCACRLEFIHPASGEKMTFELPEDPAFFRRPE